MECGKIRYQFIRYYEEQGFLFTPRAPILHPSIPMSFVMSAGLAQIETSLAKANNRSGNKYVLIQDCFRHFDLESIGADNTHLSLFEMLAAFHFAKNGRQDAVRRIWEFATNAMGIDTERIWVTYFGGGKFAGQNLHSDQPTYKAWRDAGISDNRLVALGVEHNYWVQGGGILKNRNLLRMCGAYTELFYDLGMERACGPHCQPSCRCGRFVEFSNTLFLSHIFNPENNLIKPLNDPFIETVVGTERVAMILQNVPSVFDIKEYRNLTDAIQEIVTRADLPSELIRESVCIIADHLRSLYVLVADGAPPPGKNGRERIIKLLIRRMLTRQIALGIPSKIFFPTLTKLFLEIADEDTRSMRKSISRIKEYCHKESECFFKTIERCRRKIELMLTNNNGISLSGSQILALEKNEGMPHLLTALILREKDLPYAEAEYKEARKVWKYSIN